MVDAMTLSPPRHSARRSDHDKGRDRRSNRRIGSVKPAHKCSPVVAATRDAAEVSGKES